MTQDEPTIYIRPSFIVTVARVSPQTTVISHHTHSTFHTVLCTATFLLQHNMLLITARPRLSPSQHPARTPPSTTPICIPSAITVPLDPLTH